MELLAAIECGIVTAAIPRVGKRPVSGGNSLEHFAGPLPVCLGVAVRMIQKCESPICHPNVFSGCLAGHSQDLVTVRIFWNFPKLIKLGDLLCIIGHSYSSMYSIGLAAPASRAKRLVNSTIE